MYNIEELKIRLLSELREIAEELGVKNYKTLKKDDLIYAILDQQAITPEKALPKKKPSKIDQEVSETESGQKEETTPQPPASPSPEKPKFRRQNVTEITKGSVEAEAPKDSNDAKPAKEELTQRPESIKEQAKDRSQPKKENKPTPPRDEVKSDKTSARETARPAKDEENKSRSFRPRRRALEEDELAKIASETYSEPEKELPKRESVREIEEGNLAEVVAPVRRKPTISIKEFDGIIENEGVLEIMSDGYGFLRSLDYN